MTQHRLVLVEWEDASVVDDEAAWVARTDAKQAKAMIFQQVGWLLEDTPECIVLSHALSDELMAPRDRIPRGMVRSIHQFDTAAGRLLAKPRKR